MSEMIDRVAKAICAQIGDVDWHDSIYLAKASIDAMRDPTPEMIKAAWDVTESVSPMNRMAAELASPKMQHETKMRARYDAMIDAALQSDNQGR